MNRRRIRKDGPDEGSRVSKTDRKAKGQSLLGWETVRALNEAVDAMTTETLELASLRAEEEVQPFLLAETDRRHRLRGMSAVAVTFLDANTYASFARIDAIVRHRDVVDWLLVRRWACANEDAELDEAMSGAVARHLNAELGRCLRAYVMTFVD